jgi:hypothetical protein
VDVRGPRLVLVFCVLLMGVAQFSAGLVGEPWQFYLAFGLMGGVARSGLQKHDTGDADRLLVLAAAIRRL